MATEHTYIPRYITPSPPPNGTSETHSVEIQRVAIRAGNPPNDDHPTLTVCGSACIASSNGGNFYKSDAPKLWVEGAVGVGFSSPFTNTSGDTIPFTTDTAVRLQVFGDALISARDDNISGGGNITIDGIARIRDIDPQGDNVLRIDAPTTVQDSNGRVPLLVVSNKSIDTSTPSGPDLVPTMVVGAGFIGQIESGTFSHDNPGSTDGIIDKFIVIGNSGHKNQWQAANVPKIADQDILEVKAATKHYFKGKLKKKIVVSVVQDIINDMNKTPPEPADCYGVRIQRDKSMGALQLVPADVANPASPMDTVLAWGGTEESSLRFRYVGPAVGGWHARDIIDVHPIGIVRVRGALVSYRSLRKRGRSRKKDSASAPKFDKW